MLGSELYLELDEASSAEISFIINNENEIVILSVDSKINELKSIIKHKLNYKKIIVKGANKGEVYIMPLKINTK